MINDKKPGKNLFEMVTGDRSKNIKIPQKVKLLGHFTNRILKIFVFGDDFLYKFGILIECQEKRGLEAIFSWPGYFEKPKHFEDWKHFMIDFKNYKMSGCLFVWAKKRKWIISDDPVVSSFSKYNAFQSGCVLRIDP